MDKCQDMNNLPIKPKLMAEIIERIQSTRGSLKMLNEIGMYDYNHMIEDYVLGIMNIVYAMDFKNLNNEKKNFPAIDLGDRVRRVGVQVTTNNDREKITSTLKKFFDHELDKEFDVLWIFIFGDKQAYRKMFQTENEFVFDTKEHIIDIGILVKEIEKKEEDILYKLNDYLNLKHGYFKSQLALANTEKNIVPVSHNFIPRKWIPIQYLNSMNKKIEDYYLWPKEVVRNKHRVVLVCEAGFGKTEEAKNVNNIIGKVLTLRFPVYYPLSTYNNEKLEEIVLEMYPDIPIENTALILDGFDELGESEIIFRRRLEAFNNRYPSSYVILTSRSSHFDGEEIADGGTFDEYSAFQIAPFTDEQIHQYVDGLNVDSSHFMMQVAWKGFYEQIRNAFLMVNLVDLYIADDELPESNVLFDKLIEKSIVFDKAHFRGVIKRDKYNELKDYLMSLGFISFVIDKRGFSNKHLSAIFSSEDIKILLKHVTIWQKANADKWYFIHNNFAEFLAAKFLSVLPFNEYKSLIATGDNQKLLIPRWEQVVSFLLTLCQDKALISWVVENNLDLLSKIEIHHLDDATKNMLFIRYFNEYRDKRIFMRYDVINSIINAKLIYSKLQINYLMEHINEEVHFTTVQNSISLLESSIELYGMKEEIREILSHVIENTHYRNYEKNDALRALGDHKLISCEMLKTFIRINEKNEEQYIRSGYFYVIWMVDFSDDMADYLVESYDKVNYRSKQDTNLIDQHINYEKAVGQFKSVRSIEQGIDKVCEVAGRFEPATNLVNGLLVSLKALYQNGEKVERLIFRLYAALSEKFDSTLNEVVKLVVELNIGEGLIKHILLHKSKQVIHNLDEIIDKKTADYIISWYQSDQYDGESAKEIILSLSMRNPYAPSIFKAHKEKTGEDRVARLASNEKSRKMRLQAEDRIQKIVFYEDEAEMAIQEFLDKHTDGCPVKIGDMIEDKKIQNNEYTEIDRLLSNLVIRYFNEDKMLEPKLTNLEDRSTFILHFQYYKHRNCREYRLEGEYFEEIRRICFEKVAKYQQKDFVSIVDGEYKGIYYDAIYTSYFFYIYEFDYPVQFLQKMLVIDSRYYENPRDFHKVLNRLTVEQAQKYIEDNMRNERIYGDTLIHHVDFCIENKLYDYCDEMENYLKLERDEFVGKKAAVKYIFVVKGTDYFMKNYYDELEGQLLKDVNRMLIDIDAELLAAKVKSQTRTYDNEVQRMYELQILIKCNELSGLKDYMSWIKENKRSYCEGRGYSSINEAVAQFRNPEGIFILAEMCVLMLSEDYDDDDFDNLYRNAKAALINIARDSDGGAKSVYNGVTQIMTEYDYIEDIGFMNHVLDDVIKILREENSAPLQFSQAVELHSSLSQKRRMQELNDF